MVKHLTRGMVHENGSSVILHVLLAGSRQGAALVSDHILVHGDTITRLKRTLTKLSVGASMSVGGALGDPFHLPKDTGRTFRWVAGAR